MGWESLDYYPGKRAKKEPLPDGIRVGITGNRKTSHGVIQMTIGANLARKLGLRADRESVALLVGDGAEAGMLAIAWSPHGTGPFAASGKGQGGRFVLRLNHASVGEIFSFDFQPFAVTRVEVLEGRDGQPRRIVFKPDTVIWRRDDLELAA
ncbi:hypothetical protein BSL82_10005 [Tardibacter chloracetimidivorans]|uniref:Uncharacterized protein n=1 Tax=Tardibacter chloracetimidivorans TaxID=1921510 RepID=A0A1L3ZVC4_9SPHN|nr:hypothetical protein [Tardibacter chloracetimidivorans]API59606.1 hypothetical protein BSL82_10005 [Tardibacter chloracetimidivorans]